MIKSNFFENYFLLNEAKKIYQKCTRSIPRNNTIQYTIFWVVRKVQKGITDRELIISCILLGCKDWLERAGGGGVCIISNEVSFRHDSRCRKNRRNSERSEQQASVGSPNGAGGLGGLGGLGGGGALSPSSGGLRGP